MALLGIGHSRSAFRCGRGPGRHIASLIRVGLAVLATGLLGAFTFVPEVTAQRGATVDELKAAFVYQFGNFVEWPTETFKDSSTPFAICIIGNEGVRAGLEKATKTKRIRDRGIRVVGTDARDGELVCQIIYVDDSEKGRAAEVIARHAGEPVLTVGDADDFTRIGGIIRLYQERNKPRIEINIDAAERAGLKISSKLLSLAKVVHDE